jgi:hypothetical protein
VKSAGEPFTAVLKPAHGPAQPLIVSDKGDGTYPVAYVPNAPGPMEVDVRHANTPIKGSPFKVNVASNVDLSKTKASGPGLKKAQVGKKAPFVIEAVDKNGKPVENAVFAVEVTGTKKVEPTITPAAEKGKTNVEYVCPVPGEYTVSVTHEGKPVSGTPVKLNVKKPGVPNKSTATRYTILVSVFDEDGQKVADQPLVANVSKGGKAIESSLKDLGNGDYIVEYGSAGSGSYEINVLLDGEHIAGSPFTETQK